MTESERKDKIKLALKEIGITAQSIADNYDFSKESIYALTNNNAYIPKVASAIADAIHVPHNELWPKKDINLLYEKTRNAYKKYNPRKSRYNLFCKRCEKSWDYYSKKPQQCHHCSSRFWDADIVPVSGRFKGERNINWKGGIAEYPNHSQMKRARKEKIKQTKGLCEECGNPGKDIHHKDKTKSNHELDNLIFLCQKCHMSIYHKGEAGGKRSKKLYPN